jgi:hypothetical protein
LFFSCQKAEKGSDYRDAYAGDYICDYVKRDQTVLVLPDTTIYMYSYTYDSNVLFTVSKAEDPDKLVILEQEMIVNDDGSLEMYWVPGRSISGAFYPPDSMLISQGIGKEDGYVETWNGKK